MAKVVKNNLGYLGADFQYRLVSAFVENPNFFKDLYTIIDQNMFTEQYLRAVVSTMKDYCNRHNSVPSYDMILIKLKERAMSEIDVQYFTETVEALREMTTEGIDEIEEMAEKFFKQQNWVRVANEIKRIAGDGDMDKYDDCQKLMEEAMSIGRHTDEATSPYDNIEDDLSKENITIIPTGVAKLDDCLGGGIDKGKVGLIMGSSGFGKAQPLYAKIITPDGVKRMGDMKVGDSVIGRDGQAYKVSGVFPQGVRPIYEVMFYDNTSCRCDIEHLWTVRSNNNVKDFNISQCKTLTLSEIKKTISDKGTRYYVPKNTIVNFTERELGENPYEFGRSLVNEQGAIIPEAYLYNSVENRTALLQGIMSVGGKSSLSKGNSIVLSSYMLMQDFRFLIQSLGGYTSEMKYLNRKKWKLSFTLCDESIKLFKDESKQKNVKYRVKNNQWVGIKSIKYIGDEIAQCIMVDSPEHLYLTDDCIVTHNTSMTTCLAANAAVSKTPQNNNKGFKVLQIVFEDAPRDIRRKYMSKISQVETCKINASEENTKRVREMLNNYPDKELVKNNIRIIKKDSGEQTSSDIKNIILRKINEGFKPDMVIIDYFECLKYDGQKNDSEWVQEGKTMRKFENMAKELDMAFWITTQGGRNSFSSELVTMDQGGGSIKKQQIAQVVISITRSVDDVRDQKATLAVLKNRSGSAGITLNGIIFNNGTCTISSDEVVTFDDALAYNAYAQRREDEIQRDMSKLLMKNSV
nr:MAG TPA: DnaB-like replicative helicase [Caudoviricetes sp.]